MRIEDMLPICAALDKIGYWPLKCWDGATFDVCMRYLNDIRNMEAAMKYVKTVNAGQANCIEKFSCSKFYKNIINSEKEMRQ